MITTFLTLHTHRLDLSLSLLNDSSLQSEESLRVIRMMLGAGECCLWLECAAKQ